MYLRWKTRRRQYQHGLRWNRELGCFRSEHVLRTAVLVRCSRINGAPQQQFVATLGSIDAMWLDRPQRANSHYERFALDARARCWQGMHQRLARLVERGTITQAQRERLEQQIAQTVPTPTEA